jgi:biotin synthase
MPAEGVYNPFMQLNGLRHDWTKEEVREIYNARLLDTLFAAQTVHRQYFEPGEVQLCQLLSIKTGGCPEDCAYCAQSAHYETAVARQDLLLVDDVMRTAQEARDQGVNRFCMGAAWRQVSDGAEFDTVLAMVRGVASLGLEVCCTLGMLTESQARRLAEAGLHAYNHNLDTSAEFYGRIITTRNYDDRLRTIEYVRKAGITVCCGGIIGIGESDDDRVGLLHQLATLNPHPESVPINMLAQVGGTPLAESPPVDSLVLVRTIAAARILMPSSRVRLSAGRRSLSRETIALCFMGGANSIFVGDKLLTTPNPSRSEDEVLLEDLNLKPLNHG